MLAVLPSVDRAEGDLKLSGELLLRDLAGLTDLPDEGGEVNRRRESQPSSALASQPASGSCTRSYSASYRKFGNRDLKNADSASRGTAKGAPTHCSWLRSGASASGPSLNVARRPRTRPASESSRERSFSGLAKLTFPDGDNAPAESPECDGCPAVTLNVFGELRRPELEIALRGVTRTCTVAWRCQKHPCTTTTVRCFGERHRGGRGDRPTWSRNRQPILMENRPDLALRQRCPDRECGTCSSFAVRAIVRPPSMSRACVHPPSSRFIRRQTEHVWSAVRLCRLWPCPSSTPTPAPSAGNHKPAVDASSAFLS